MEVPDLRGLKELEAGNARLKRTVADEAPDTAGLKDLLSRTMVTPRAKHEAVGILTVERAIGSVCVKPKTLVSSTRDSTSIPYYIGSTLVAKSQTWMLRCQPIERTVSHVRKRGLDADRFGVACRKEEIGQLRARYPGLERRILQAADRTRRRAPGSRTAESATGATPVPLYRSQAAARQTP